MVYPNDSRLQVRTADGLKYCDVDFEPYSGHCTRTFYDAIADPWETHNLIKDPAAQGWILAPELHC